MMVAVVGRIHATGTAPGYRGDRFQAGSWPSAAGPGEIHQLHEAAANRSGDDRGAAAIVKALSAGTTG